MKLLLKPSDNKMAFGLIITFISFLLNTANAIQPSGRSNIESFKVMDVMGRAIELESEGRHICHMEVGQPGSSAPQKVIEKAKLALSNDLLGYTNALGIASLRNEISKHYLRKYNTHIPAERIVVTTGSSAGFLLSFIGVFDEGSCGKS